MYLRCLFNKNMRPNLKIIYALTFSMLLLKIAGAQDVTTVEAINTDISDNLDLRAVASLFGVCENIEDFERRLNDPESQISNLDLNGDNEVDYLRVIEVSKNGTYVITIQAVIGKDLFQDVATIDVEKDGKGETRVQVVGDVYMYGQDYIIEPYYERPPVVYVYLWGPRYHPWYSPYYYGYYPAYYHPWNPYPTYYYIDHVHVHRSAYVTYSYTTHRYSSNAVALQSPHRRVDYQASKPEQSFAARNEGLSNKGELIKQREQSTPSKTSGNSSRDGSRPNGKAVQQGWKPSGSTGNEGTKVSVPSSKLISDPTAKPKIDLSKDPNPRPTSTTTPTAKPVADPYGRQPSATPIKQDSYTRPSDVRTSQPQNQYSKPSMGPNTLPSSQQRTAPTPTTPQKPSSMESVNPSRSTKDIPAGSKPQTNGKQSAKKPAKQVQKSGSKPTDSRSVRP